MKVDNSELKPCPFCGDVPNLHKDKLIQGNNKAIVIKCVNDDCLIKPVKVFDSSFQTHDEIKIYAVNAWNSRG